MIDYVETTQVFGGRNGCHVRLILVEVQDGYSDAAKVLTPL
jgi:hypothetical protein